jgi:glycerol kinase
MAKYVAAIDQGTTSTRCMIFDHSGSVVAVEQKEHEQIFPKPGWVEHDAKEIWQNTQEVIEGALRKTGSGKEEIAAVGITNQRETALVWDRTTASRSTTRSSGRTRGPTASSPSSAATGGRTASAQGRPAAGDLLLGPEGDVDPRQRRGRPGAAEAGDLVFGNIDTWLIWNLTGGTDGGVFATDPTNASRTLAMDLQTLDWDDEILGIMGIPRSMMPEIKFSSGEFGTISAGPLQGLSLAGDLGDQQAAVFGQTCFDVGDAKNTYGTGNFMLLNTARSSSTRRTACSRRSATRSARRPRSTAWRGRSPSRGRSSSGCGTT